MTQTLAQVKLNLTDDLQVGIIDEFQKNSFMLNNLTFHDCVSPVGGGGTMTYAYTRLVSQPTAAFRAINGDYTDQEVARQRYSVDLKVLGGSFSIDRVLADFGGIVDEVELQARQKVKAVTALFNDCVINGDSAVRENEFDGLNVMLTGTNTEYNKTNAIDLSSSANVTANYQEFLDMLDEFLSKLDGRPDALLMNKKLKNKMRAVARRAGMYQVTKDTWGNQVEYYGDIPMIDLGEKCGTTEDVIKTDGTGLTDMYAVRFGMDGFHGVSLAGQSPVKIWLPDFHEAATIDRGAVEMVGAVALKSSKAAGVFRKIKVQ